MLTQRFCQICGDPTPLLKRKGRPNGFRYPRRCEKCRRKPRNMELWRENVSAAKRGLKNPSSLPIFSERIRESKGYRYVQIKVAPSGRWPLKHRWIMEQHLGRKLKSSEVVHHIDGNTLNNAFENLKLMSDFCHKQLHSIIPTWTKKHDSCIVCGTTTKNHVGRGLCTTCYYRSQAIKS